jgi:hypothetical protein
LLSNHSQERLLDTDLWWIWPVVRQYLPKGADLSMFSQAEFDAIAARLNSWPHKTLYFATSDEVFAGLVDKVANAVTSRSAGGVRYATRIRPSQVHRAFGCLSSPGNRRLSTTTAGGGWEVSPI